PRGVRPRTPPRGHGRHQALGCGRDGPDLDHPREQDAGVEESAAHHGERLRSSSTSAARSTSGSFRADTVGRATHRRPTRTNRGPGTLRTSRTETSSAITSSWVPGRSRYRSRMAAGITTRPALSMVVFMALRYHPTIHEASTPEAGRPVDDQRDWRC